MIDSLPPLVLCSTNRLAQSIRQAHGRAQIARGLKVWQPLQAVTLTQWLNDLTDTALLTGGIDAELAPRMVLDGVQERILWQRMIESAMADNALAALFDVGGMANAAIEANRLLLAWNVVAPDGDMTEETRQFMRWRDDFRQLCKQNSWLEQARFFDWQIEHLARGAGQLPAEIFLSGFDRISPQEQRLLDVLVGRGTVIHPWENQLPQPGIASKVGLTDQDAECRAAVAWCRRQLSADPQARIGLVVPELAELREKLANLLDDALHPEAINPAGAEAPRCYDFSLGMALAEQPLVGVALKLMRLAAANRRVTQQDISALLLSPYWSADIHEADARAQIDALMRSSLPAAFSLERFSRFIQKHQSRGLGLGRLDEHVAIMLQQSQIWPKRQLPSGWTTAWQALLQAVQWPGERSLSSHEFQARQALSRLLEQQARLDAVLGPVSATEALRHLEQACREQIFQPQSEGEPRILVMGMLESVAEPLAALWVMGMNDHLWPPPTRPNPLLPAQGQRNAGAPNADSRIQAQFARSIHQRLLRSAPYVVFSFAHKDGERELRPSPLLADMAVTHEAPALALTMAEQLAQTAPMEWLEDHLAPPVAPGEKIGGGTGLLKAQAICPAWAYYRYRLGARALEEPVEGLDAMGRGNLLHAALQHFWQGRDSTQLQAMDDTALQEAIRVAVDQGTQAFNEKQEEPLPPRFLVLEQQRLQHLLGVWLPLEKTRPPFSVEQCEQRLQLDLGGITVDLTIDRVDRLPDGQLVVLDYKTGSVVSQKSWADTRITEPQLPIYAAMALSGNEVAAVCFAKVRIDEQKFIGIAAEEDLLPGVAALSGARKLFDEAQFSDWYALMQHWQASIAAIVGEIRSGEAATRFADENDLRDCELKPLLRLPERQLQTERDKY